MKYDGDIVPFLVKFKSPIFIVKESFEIYIIPSEILSNQNHLEREN